MMLITERVWAEILESGLHDVFFNVNNFLHNMPTVWRTPSNELWTILQSS